MKELGLIIDKLYESKDATDEELTELISNGDSDDYLFEKADCIRRKIYGNKVYIRGLIEISNYCKNDCLYCGIRASNANAVRYRLDKKMIMECCKAGYSLGFRTFVMQGGEDSYYSDDRLCDIISEIKKNFPDCAVTLSVGERSLDSYRKLKQAGADRYLLRHETADSKHYSLLHPSYLSLEKRMNCLFDLKSLGYQVGSGFMVGSPYQKTENLIQDLRFLQKLSPDMIGIGPFIPHIDTDFKNERPGNLELTLRLIAILRLMFPHALIPATTALASIASDGRERGLLAGANVVMPNLSPADSRKHYSLYNNKAHSGKEAAESLDLLKKDVKKAGYRVVTDRGDVAR